MLRRHFITGDEKPDFIITYYAPQHIPFSSNYKDVLRGYNNIDTFGDENNTVFKCVLDKWEDGIGEYGIKILNWFDRTWYNTWSYRQSVDITNINVGSLGFYIDIENNVQKDVMSFDHIITDVILPNEIKHLNGSLVVSYLDEYNSSVVNVRLPENLETLSNHVLRALHVLKSITIPSSVIYMGYQALKINCDSDNIMSLTPGNQSLEEIIMKPIIPPSTDINAEPIGNYNLHQYINPNLKIRVYADRIDTYKNDNVWGQYSDLYDTINNAVIYKTVDSKIINLDSDNILSNVESGEPNRFVVTFKDDIVENNTFCYKENLQEIILPNLITIENHAFAYCKNLKKINIPNTVTITSNNAFLGTYFGKNNIVGDYTKITENGGYVFDIETEDGYFITKYSEGDILEQIRLSIKNVIISDDIKYIGDNNANTFYNNNTIKSIYIGKNVKGNVGIGFSDDRLDLSLGHSDNIKSLKVDPLNPYYDSRNDCNAVIETATNTLLVGCPTTIIPNTVEIIEYNRAFHRIKINTLNIPLSVNKIIDIYRPDTVNYTQINTIIYEGTIEQWDAIEKIATVYEKAAITIKCSDGEIKYFTKS